MSHAINLGFKNLLKTLEVKIINSFYSVLEKSNTLIYRLYAMRI